MPGCTSAKNLILQKVLARILQNSRRTSYIAADGFGEPRGKSS
jgi:hypothetical protein